MIDFSSIGNALVSGLIKTATVGLPQTTAQSNKARQYPLGSTSKTVTQGYGAARDVYTKKGPDSLAWGPKKSGLSKRPALKLKTKTGVMTPGTTTL